MKKPNDKPKLNQPARRRFMRQTSHVLGGLALSSLLPMAHATKPQQRWASYQQSIVIDGLCIAADDLVGASEQAAAQVIATIRQSGITAINETVTYPGSDFKQAAKNVAARHQLCEQYPQAIKLIRRASDIGAAKNHQQLGLIMGFQSTEMFEGDIENIQVFADLGVKIMQLSYNNQSDFGAGCLVKNAQGLTEMGQQAVVKMNQLKVLIDLSHAAKPTVQQALKHSTSPITLSHTGCNALYQHPRNNDDEDLRAVAAGGGVVGIYLMPFLEGGEAEIKAEMVIKHIEHALKVCGSDHVGIGSDQGITPVNDTPEYREMIRQEVLRRQQAGISAPGETPNRPPFIPQLNHERRMEMIAWHLHQRKYSDAVIEKILGGNFHRLFKTVW